MIGGYSASEFRGIVVFWKSNATRRFFCWFCDECRTLGIVEQRSFVELESGLSSTASEAFDDPVDDNSRVFQSRMEVFCGLVSMLVLFGNGFFVDCCGLEVFCGFEEVFESLQDHQRFLLLLRIFKFIGRKLVGRDEKEIVGQTGVTFASLVEFGILLRLSVLV